MSGIFPFLIYFIIFGSIGLLAYATIPLFYDKATAIQKKTTQDSLLKSEELYMEAKKTRLLYIISPIVLGLVSWLIFQKVAGVIIGLGISLAVPSFVLNIMIAKRRKKFVLQLIDSLMILSSSLKGGLSLIQSIEVLCEEMPSPTKEEFSLMIREIKMGVSVEEALDRVSKRMPSEELDLVISSILVARETGGDLTKVFSRLISTIRERLKLKETIATYTLQGKIQGIIMSILPVVFFFWVQKFNPHHFDEMWQTNLGRMLLIVAVVMEIVALFLIKKFSTIKI